MNENLKEEEPQSYNQVRENEHTYDNVLTLWISLWTKLIPVTYLALK